MSLAGVTQLLEVMKQLRDPKSGCGWDLKQSFDTIVPYTLEEAYEVADAIYRNNMSDVKDELGDLLFQVVFYAQLGDEQQLFDFDAIAKGAAEKLIRRHPHVFADTEQSLTEQQLAAQWQRIKQQERNSVQPNENRLLANISAGLSPLLRANKIQQRCATVGFDWTELAPVVAKVKEEIDEVLDAQQQVPKNPGHVEEEVGDLLFAVVNLARHLEVDPEQALQKANNKFIKRFDRVEGGLTCEGKSLSESSLEEMEAMWQLVKNNETSS